MANYSGMFGNGQLPDILNSAMAGARIPYEMEGADQSLQEQRTKNLSDSEKLRMMIESENPTKTAQNDVTRATAQKEADPNFIQAMIDAKVAEAGGKGLKYDEDRKAAQRALIVEMGDELNAKIKRNQKPYDPMDATSKGQWDDWAAQAKKLGIPGFPEVPDTQPDGSSKAIQDILTKRAAMGEESTGYKTKLALAEAPGRIQERIHADTNASAERRAASSDASKEEVANIRAAASAAKAKQNQSVIQAVVEDIKAGNTPRPALMNLAAETAYNSANKDTPLGLRAILIETDNSLTMEQKDQKKEDWKKDWIKKTFTKGASPTEDTTPTQATPKSAKVEVGTISKGYRFKGGDPAIKSNWEEVPK